METLTHGTMDFYEILSEGPVDALFYESLLARSYKFVGEDSWVTDGIPTVDFAALGLEVRLEYRHNALQTTYLLDGEQLVVKINLSHRGIGVRAAAKKSDPVTQLLRQMREMVPEMRPNLDDGSVPVTFWTYTMRGPQAHTRRIDAHTWNAISGNYGTGVSHELAHLMSNTFRPAFGGQLILWHGVPGTGKTHALRALAWEWRNWADFHYIVDPEKLFGEHADYLIQVLMAEDERALMAMVDDEEPGAQPEAAKPRWKVLILEDTGEMLAPDAKDRIGQALSRLLNTVDGFIGQGLRVLVLVTTNEELGALHPAVARPGRCAAKTLFKTLTIDEAKVWVQENGGDPNVVTGAKSLAELYGTIEGFTNVPEPSLVGFTS